MDVRFGQQLALYLRQRNLSQSAFSRMVGCTSAYISQVLRHLSAAPDDVDVWADALGLKGEARTAFLDMAALTRTPERIIERLDRVENRVGSTLRVVEK